MYGYIRPDKRELRVREYELFRATYCGLCETLRSRYGLCARFAVNYDLTFLAMALSDLPGAEIRRCPIHPLRRRPCVCGGPALNAAADYSVILARWKLADAVDDEKGGRALLASTGQAIWKSVYEKAAARRPDFDGNTRKCLEDMVALEKDGCQSLDRMADCFARIIAFAAGGTARERILRELFYHVGRYVYILDAVDDLEEDIRLNRYNPLRYRLRAGATSLDDGQQQALRETLNLSQRSAVAALSLRDADPWQPILENILTIGLPEVTELVFSRKWRDKKRARQGRVPVLKE